MRHHGLVAFTHKEWEMFLRLRDESLPRRFPEAEIAVTRHPAEFTQPWDLERIAAATGEALPPDAQRRVERWQARSGWERWRERTYWTRGGWWYRFRMGKLWSSEEETAAEMTVT